MQKQVSSNGLLIVVELGAEWPAWLGGELAAPARRVLAQDESEAPAAFARRVAEQLNGLFARGVALGRAFILCSERLDEAARAARWELARSVANALARGTGGVLQLTATDLNAGRSRAAFNTLQRELAAEWHSAAIETKLCFEGGARALDEAVSVSPAEPSTRSTAKRGPGKDNARRVA